MTDSSKPNISLPLYIAIGWGVGTVVPSIMFNITNIWLMPYMTNFMGIAAGAAGAIFALSKIYDAVTDPLMGVISDKTRTRWGRHRPYLVLGAVVSALSILALFAPPEIVTGDMAVWYMLFGLVLYSTGYTIFNVPYLAMPAEMTQNYHERSFLMSWRVTAIQIAQIAALIGSSFLLSIFGSDRDGYASVAWIMAGLIVAAGCISCLMTAKAPRHEVPTGPTPPFREQLRTVAGNKPFLQLVGIKFMMLLANSFSFGAYAYFVLRVLQEDTDTMGYMFTASTSSALIAIPIWLRISRKIGKQKSLMIACSILALTSLSWLLAGPGDPLYQILLRPFGTGIAAAGMLMVGQSMLPDTIEYDRRRTGLERAGVFAGIYTTAEKMAYALGPALTGILLSSMGYVSGTQGMSIEQPESAITAIYIAIGIAPGVCLLGAIFLVTFYKLDEEKLKATTLEAAPAQ